MVEIFETKVIVGKNKTRVVSAAKVGPMGPRGPEGLVSSMDEIPDVQLEGLGDNHILQYDTMISKWTNRPQEDIVDGGNF